MSNVKYLHEKNGLKLIIEEDIVGFYLIVYQSSDLYISSEDYLLDSLEDAFNEAWDKFGVTKEQWQKIQ